MRAMRTPEAMTRSWPAVNKTDRRAEVKPLCDNTVKVFSSGQDILPALAVRALSEGPSMLSALGMEVSAPRQTILFLFDLETVACARSALGDLEGCQDWDQAMARLWHDTWWTLLQPSGL
ncbi:hypothetical protein NDU88_003733 [Pleurodeles waltl]|uniref:Uncharacterized protein n=1 Tax=Pleurodeles waltl TaxID=8319 RepID=A0AAV7QCW6_PLEWA|nr:hypothetical protein NDU88_003733 [Pleurodeles waltl]